MVEMIDEGALLLKFGAAVDVPSDDIEMAA